MTHWCRLWEDMPDDPKWRLIARRSGASIAEVGWVFIHMMRNAACSRQDGAMRSWSDEVVAVSLDVETSKVKAIREAMQGLVLDGDSLSGWALRQPKREDFGAAERSFAYRARQKEIREGGVIPALTANEAPLAIVAPATPAAPVAPVVIEPAKKPRKPRVEKNRARMTEKHQPDEKDKQAAADAGLTKEEFRFEWTRFRDYHMGRGTLIADINATWRTWLGNRKTMNFGVAKDTGKGHESNFTKAARGLLEEYENVTTDGYGTIASTLPDSAFSVASDTVISVPLGAEDTHDVLDLEPIRTERSLESVDD